MSYALVAKLMRISTIRVIPGTTFCSLGVSKTTRTLMLFFQYWECLNWVLTKYLAYGLLREHRHEIFSEGFRFGNLLELWQCFAVLCLWLHSLCSSFWLVECSYNFVVQLSLIVALTAVALWVVSHHSCYVLLRCFQSLPVLGLPNLQGSLQLVHLCYFFKTIRPPALVRVLSKGWGIFSSLVIGCWYRY